MTRKEQIWQHALVKAKKEPDDFVRGAEWADKNPIHYDGKAYFHVAQASEAIAEKRLVEKACKWLASVRLEYYASHEEEFIKDFRNAMIK